MHANSREGLALKMRRQGKNLNEIATALGVPKKQAAEITHFAVIHARSCATALKVKVFGTISLTATGQIVHKGFKFEYVMPARRRPAQLESHRLHAIANYIQNGGGLTWGEIQKQREAREIR
jgi:hypothetical protein